MFLRTVLLENVSFVYCARNNRLYVHARELAGGTTGHLLNAKLKQILAELSHLTQQIRFRLVLKLLSANLSLCKLVSQVLL